MNKSLIKAKFFASGIHISISFVIFLIMMSWFLTKLYPSFYFNMSGGIRGLALLFGCDVVLGPVLTFVIFNPKKPKKEIISDLMIVGAVQVCAFIYGLITVYQGRPYLGVLYGDGNATVLPHIDVKDDEFLAKYNPKNFEKFEGVPFAIFKFEGEKKVLVNLSQNPDDVKKADKNTRRFLSDELKKELAEIEKNNKDVFIFSLMGKMTGAIIVMDKNYKYLTRFGERPM